MRILLIEDDTDTAAYLAKGLGELGHNVHQAHDGRDGLFMALDQPYETLVVDRMLPGMDGLSVIRAMRAAGNRTPVLILSALGEVDARVEGLRAGGDTGPGIPLTAREKVFERFFRLETSRSSPGNGLGLSLVDAIVSLHHGRIELTDNQPGLNLAIRLPRSF